VTEVLPEWWFGGILSRLIPLKEFSRGPSALTQKQFGDACQTATLLEQFRLDTPERPAELALQRFALGCGRSDAIDSILDFVIALEALLLPYDPGTRFADLSYRFRVHGAHFIAGSKEQRRSVFRALNKLYEIRSRIVHGDNYPDAEEAIAAANEARGLAARGLLKAVHHGFPDPPLFNRMVLGQDDER